MEDSKMQRAKVFCFDNSITLKDLERAWNNAVAQEQPIISNLHRNGMKYWELAPHLMKQLIERYGEESRGD
jgi:hypothetical protein